jgi:hypothetical protein
MGGIGGGEVDIEADFTILQVETYHPALGQEVGGLSHCKDRHPTQTPHDCCLALGFVATEKEDVAVSNFLQLAYLPDVEYPPSGDLAVDHVLEFLTARLVVKNA